MPMRCIGALGLWLTLAGCARESSFPAICSNGAGGDAEEGGAPLCPPPSVSLRWAAQIVPPNAQGANKLAQNLTQQDVLPLVFGAGGDVGMATLRFTPPALLNGTLQDSSNVPVPRARVTITLPSLIPGQSPAAVTATTDAQGAFLMPVPVAQNPKEQPHRVWITFDDPGQAARRPPLSRSASIAASTDLQLKLPPESGYSTVNGRVLDQTGAGVAGMRVQVVDSHGDILSSTALTNEGKVNEAAGSFRLTLDPQLSEDPRLWLVAQSAQQGAGLPVLVRPLVRPVAPADLIADLRLPAMMPPAPYRLQVQGAGPSGTQLALAGARVQADVRLTDSLLGEQQALYITSGETDRQGLVVLQLVPWPQGQYQFHVTSPAGSPLASDTLRRVIGAERAVPALQLGLRPLLTGQLVSTSGPVAGVQVVARSIAQPDLVLQPMGQDVPLLNPQPETPQPQTQTDESGHFALRLDPGDYDLEVVPPAGTQVRYSVDNLRVASDMALGPVQLPRPTLGQVRVLGPEGYEVSRATVRVFQLPEQPPKPGTCVLNLPCSLAAKLRAELSTDSKGVARFVLPDAQ